MQNGRTLEDRIEQIEKSSDWNEAEKKENIRKILISEKGMTDAATDTFFYLRYEGNHKVPDCFEAVESSGGDTMRAIGYFKDCSICYATTVMSRLTGHPNCECQVCRDCFTQYFSLLVQSTPCMYKFVCPACDQPDLKSSSEKEFGDYFSYLDILLKYHLCKDDCDLYHQKLGTWALIKEKNFRWCAHGCGNGFIREHNIKKIQCTNCNKYQCFDCKKPWLDEHDDSTCEAFEKWKIYNDPEIEAMGLAAHLKEHGINCPRCKMRYELAKGGCMHFKCFQCMHEFCCGCNLPFMKYPNCKIFPSCNGKGLHAHHPRDCLYYLRDEDSENLQKLLQDHCVVFTRAEVVANLPKENSCPVKEQREYSDGFEDVNCGRSLHDETALCETHYKEYLVSLINQNKIDPADIFTIDYLQTVLGRHGQQVPIKCVDEAPEMYYSRLKQLLKEQIPL